MQRSLLTLAVAACLAVGACGGDDDDDGNAQTLPDPTQSSASEEPASESGAVLTQEQAAAALPTVADLPTGWAVDPDNTTGGDDEDDDSDTVTPPECATVLDALDEEQAEASVTAAAAFAEGDLGPFLGVEVNSYEPGQEPDEAQYQAVLDALAGCPTFTVTDAEGTAAEFTAAALSFPELGDATVALRFSVTASDLPFTLDLVNVTSGNNTVGTTSLAFGGSPDAALAESVTRATLDRLEEIAG